MSRMDSIGIDEAGIVWFRGFVNRCEESSERPAVLLATTILLACFLVAIFVTASFASDSYEQTYSKWEALLWGDKVGVHAKNTQSLSMPYPSVEKGKSVGDKTVVDSLVRDSICDIFGGHPPCLPPSIEETSSEQPVPSIHIAGLSAPALTLTSRFPNLYCRDPFSVLSLKNIPPLYLTPRLVGEGVWNSKNMPKGSNGWPTVYQTSYRPSERYPNAVVHMLLFDMRQVAMRLYVGSSEPGASQAASRIEPHYASRLLAITNGLWKRRHSHGAGAVFNGRVLEKPAPGMATVVVYKDYTVDIVEWNDSIPISKVLDARQLKHLIVKEGKVVRSIVEKGRVKDSEIGLGYLLVEEMPVFGRWGPYGPLALNHTHGHEWFIATRSAFGIRPDGNLVFAAGHHISTKDLAKALVLAGCVRGLHGDANPHNVLGNLYYTDKKGAIVEMANLSPEQKHTGLHRYIAKAYTNDFFAFFKK